MVNFTLSAPNEEDSNDKPDEEDPDLNIIGQNVK
jgi:hypothetical protein